MWSQLEFNFAVGHAPLPMKPALMADSKINPSSDPQHSITHDRRQIACKENHSARSPRNTSLRLQATRAYLCIRRALRGRNYVAVQIVPAGIEPLSVLKRARAEKSGIKIVYVGEGYRERNGPHSSFGHAIAAAKAYIAESGLVDAGEF